MWASWVLEKGDRKIWFAGDTGYNPLYFKQIGVQSPGIDVALIPIGGYAPRELMEAHHINPFEAVQIHKDVGAKKSIGMNGGAFPLTAEAPMDPTAELKRQKKDQGLDDDEFVWLKLGQTIRIE